MVGIVKNLEIQIKKRRRPCKFLRQREIRVERKRQTASDRCLRNWKGGGEGSERRQSLR